MLNPTINLRLQRGCQSDAFPLFRFLTALTDRAIYKTRKQNFIAFLKKKGNPRRIKNKTSRFGSFSGICWVESFPFGVFNFDFLTRCSTSRFRFDVNVLENPTFQETELFNQVNSLHD